MSQIVAIENAAMERQEVMETSEVQKTLRQTSEAIITRPTTEWSGLLMSLIEMLDGRTYLARHYRKVLEELQYHIKTRLEAGND